MSQPGHEIARQLFLHEVFSPGATHNETVSVKPPLLTVLNWNIQNPSLRRARQQAYWITELGVDIAILTEAKYSEGCLFIRDWLASNGFQVSLSKPEGAKDSYCTLLAIRGFHAQTIELSIDFLPERVVACTCETRLGTLCVLGMYVPSRGPLSRRNIDKRRFQDQIMELLPGLVNTAGPRTIIVGGDMNVVEREHISHYSVFGEWEYAFYESFVQAGLFDAYRCHQPSGQDYSWFGREARGYRFDHLFVSSNLAEYVINCSYLQSTRTLGLSDHAAMVLQLAFANVKDIENACD